MENLKTKNQILLFKNEEFGKVRGLEINGEPWLVGKDVAEILGYSNPLKAIRDHVDEEDKGVNEMVTPRRETIHYFYKRIRNLFINIKK